MCGIYGIVDFTKMLNLDDLICATEKLFKRGPDDGDYKIWNTTCSKVGFGHRRLSIVDLSKKGSQPFVYENLAIVYNGEVYNFKELRQDLVERNYDFVSNSDTEVVLKYIHCFGLEAALVKFNGMFAFGLFDFTEEKLIIVRDRLGVKPLYYYCDNNKFIFSSEIKSLLVSNGTGTINKKNVGSYLQYGYVPAPDTLWNGIKKLRHGRYFELDINSREDKEIEYWNYSSIINSEQNYNIEDFEQVVQESIRLRCDADVEVGCFLSGGYDSSLTAAMMQRISKKPIKTFTIGFSESEFDESGYAKNISKYIGSEHHQLICTPDFVRSIISELPDIWDDPIADSSVFPTLLVSQLACKHVKVALSSDGGDELFAGYNHYSNSLLISGVLKFLPFKKFLGICFRFLISGHRMFYSSFARKIRRLSRIIEAKSALEVKKSFQTIFDEDEVNLLLGMKVENNIRSDYNLGNLNTMLVDDVDHPLADKLLPKVDRASMHSSLEAREPLLDINIVNFSARLREKHKIKDSIKKYPLKELAHKYLPKELLIRPKKGFSIPLRKWLKKDLSKLIETYFDKDKFDHTLFDKKALRQILNRYKKGESISFNQLWCLLMFQVWYVKWSKYIK